MALLIVRAHPGTAGPEPRLTVLIPDSAETKAVNSQAWPQQWSQGWAKLHLECKSSSWGGQVGLGEAGHIRKKMVC